MVIDEIRKYCHTLAAVTEDVKWGNDLCFSIGGKMFCVTSLTEPFGISFKAKDDEFDELSNSQGFIPAPYVARNKWVLLQDAGKAAIAPLVLRPLFRPSSFQSLSDCGQEIREPAGLIHWAAGDVRLLSVVNRRGQLDARTFCNRNVLVWSAFG